MACRSKMPLLNYKGKNDLYTYLQEFNNVCTANQEAADAIKLQLYPVTLRMKALKWYIQFPT